MQTGRSVRRAVGREMGIVLGDDELGPLAYGAVPQVAFLAEYDAVMQQGVPAQFGSILIMIAQDGLYQYNYSDLQNIVQLSKIPIGGK